MSNISDDVTVATAILGVLGSLLDQYRAMKNGGPNAPTATSILAGIDALHNSFAADDAEEIKLEDAKFPKAE